MPMDGHWGRVKDTAKLLVGNFFIVVLCLLLLAAIQKLVSRLAPPNGPMFFGLFPAEWIIEAGELAALVLVVWYSISDLRTLHRPKG